MVCLYCKSSTSVTNSRPQKRLNQVWRRRVCSECGAIFSTTEAVNYTTAVITQNHEGKLTPFQKERLFLSILKTCEHRKDALNDAIALTETVLTKIMENTPSASISLGLIATATHSVLKNFDSLSSVQYAALHPEYDYEG